MLQLHIKFCSWNYCVKHAVVKLTVEFTFKQMAIRFQINDVSWCPLLTQTWYWKATRFIIIILILNYGPTYGIFGIKCMSKKNSLRVNTNMITQREAYVHIFFTLLLSEMHIQAYFRFHVLGIFEKNAVLSCCYCTRTGMAPIGVFILSILQILEVE